jgi:hypothetical protein
MSLYEIDKDKQELRKETVFQINLLYKVVNLESKTGRNNMCYCGSGIKFKNCCLPEHEEKTERLNELMCDLNKLDSEHIKSNNEK